MSWKKLYSEVAAISGEAWRMLAAGKAVGKAVGKAALEGRKPGPSAALGCAAAPAAAGAAAPLAAAAPPPPLDARALPPNPTSGWLLRTSGYTWCELHDRNGSKLLLLSVETNHSAPANPVISSPFMQTIEFKVSFPVGQGPAEIRLFLSRQSWELLSEARSRCLRP